jgi:TonB family protein
MANQVQVPQPEQDELNLLPLTGMDESLWSSLRGNLRAAMDRSKTPVNTQPGQGDVHLLVRTSADDSLWKSLTGNIRAAFFPEKLPPLQLTSKPVRVREIWGEDAYKKQSASVSLVVHALMVAGLVALSIAGTKVVKDAQKHESITLISPDLTPPLPMSKDGKSSGGGGGGGDRDKLQAPKGKLPKQSMEQITPPAVVIRNPNPKLAVEPTVVVPPQIKLANNMPDIGNPLAAIPSGPPSNGTGSGGGIGSGNGGGVGSGSGPGVGPGHGGGIGGGAFRVGNGVSAPRALDTPDPEYSEEARKAKYQGTVVLWLVVGPDGKPRDIKVARALGMGLDQKAIEAVRNWKFEPAMKDGKPVAVQINVEVNFRLY